MSAQPKLGHLLCMQSLPCRQARHAEDGVIPPAQEQSVQQFVWQAFTVRLKASVCVECALMHCLTHSGAPAVPPLPGAPEAPPLPVAPPDPSFVVDELQAAMSTNTPTQSQARMRFPHLRQGAGKLTRPTMG